MRRRVSGRSRRGPRKGGAPARPSSGPSAPPSSSPLPCASETATPSPQARAPPAPRGHAATRPPDRPAIPISAPQSDPVPPPRNATSRVHRDPPLRPMTLRAHPASPSHRRHDTLPRRPPTELSESQPDRKHRDFLTHPPAGIRGGKGRVHGRSRRHGRPHPLRGTVPLIANLAKPARWAIVRPT